MAVISLAFCSAAILAVSIIGLHKGFSINDPALTELLSYIGLMFWSASVAVCFMAALHLLYAHQGIGLSSFLLGSGCVCTLLMFDDVSLNNEGMVRNVLELDERIVYTGYALIMVAYIIIFSHLIQSTDYMMFFVAVLFLGFTPLADRLLPGFAMEHFLRGCLKFIGIVFWSAFFLSAAIGMVGNFPREDVQSRIAG